MRVRVIPRDFQRVLVPSPYCGTCPINQLCHEGLSELGCPPDGPVHKSVLHPSKPDWLPRIAEVNGFDLDYPAVDQDIPMLPSYVPRTRFGRATTIFQSANAIALPLEEVKRLAAQVISSGRSARELLGLTQRQLLVVLGFERDEFLEQAWLFPERGELIRAIKVVDPDVAIAWSYSVWHRHSSGWIYPRVEHLYNIKRSMIIYADLQKMGIPAIPHLYWGLREDLDRWANWLQDNPCVSTIAIDLQTTDTGRDWQTAMEEIEYLRSILPRDIRLLFSGVCHIDKVIHLREVWPNLSVCNYAALFALQFRFKRQYGLRSPWVMCNNWSDAAIVESVVHQYEEVIQNERSTAERLEILQSDLKGVGGQDEVAGQSEWPDDRTSGVYAKPAFPRISDREDKRKQGISHES